MKDQVNYANHGLKYKKKTKAWYYYGNYGQKIERNPNILGSESRNKIYFDSAESRKTKPTVVG